MNKTALIVRGGWEGHRPEQISAVFRRILEQEGFTVTESDTLSIFDNGDVLKSCSLIVPMWTMGSISEEQCSNVDNAVARGTGLAGIHGGMCDAFRSSPQWQFITGGSWVAHPGNDGVSYRVNFCNSSSPLTEGLEDFTVCSEQYYLHVDPAVEVLATTRFPVSGGPHESNGCVDMPLLWTKRWGKGRVWYSSLGHHEDIADSEIQRELTRRGFLWASGNRL